MKISGIMVIAMASIIERMMHRMDEKVQQLRLSNSKAESTNRECKQR